METRFPRGAEWRQWDLHVHTPASFEWRGKRLRAMSADERDTSLDELATAMNQSETSAFGLMDYWTFDGWLALKARQRAPDAVRLEKVVFPGIELRLVSPAPYRLNAHVLFDSAISDQDLTNFKAQLKVALIEQPLSDECLIRLAREKLGPEKLQQLGTTREAVIADADAALLAGSKAAEITQESYTDAVRRVPGDQAVGFMPFTTHDGLADVDWKEHYSYVLTLMKTSPIFETRKPDLWAAFVGVETPGNRDWFKNFQAALDGVPRLAVCGSDAHRYSDYGRFPNGRATWLKCDPTFRGLRQAIREPANRSYLGEVPPKVTIVRQNASYFIDSVVVSKREGSNVAEAWMHGCSVPLSGDLIAIIGSKGSGKSALTDIIALLGHSRQSKHFSFLSSQRFRAKPRNFASHFIGALKWMSGAQQAPRGLDQDPSMEDVEMVRYIPQAHFERLCNDHVTGKSDDLERELRAVIFSHATREQRQAAVDFDALVDQQEAVLRAQISEHRKNLGTINAEIERLEGQLHPEVAKALSELRELRERQLADLQAIEPVPPPDPDAEPTPEAAEAEARMREASVELDALIAEDAKLAQEASAQAAVAAAARDLMLRIELVRRQIEQFKVEVRPQLLTLGLSVDEVCAATFYEEPVRRRQEESAKRATEIAEARQTRASQRELVLARRQEEAAKLDGPRQRRQQWVEAHSQWEAKRKEVVGDTTVLESLEGIKARIAQRATVPAQLLVKRAERRQTAGLILASLQRLRRSREELFAPVQELISKNRLIRDEYRLQFVATLGASAEALSDRLFALVKQNSGEFRGVDESRAVVRRLLESVDIEDESGLLVVVDELETRLESAARALGKDEEGIADLMRNTRSPKEVYDLLFGLLFVEPRYSLLFQETRIEKLSPGQRGALLLIFYLLVDKGRQPIILDQPEENLDNETIVNLLVPVVAEARRYRQVMMVTHNPNLAVVCDAEQIVYCEFERKDRCAIEYTSGSIEDERVNKYVVNVLEGTLAAFLNRDGKYHRAALGSA